MKFNLKFLLLIILLLSYDLILSQTEYHVFPIDHPTTPGSDTGNGTLTSPWDLQTALTNGNGVNGGDTIWLHDGIYTGRYMCNISGSNGNNITISSYPGEWAVINGNIPISEEDLNDIEFLCELKGSVITQNGANLTFRDFEITYLDEYTRVTSWVDCDNDGLNDKCTTCVGGLSHNSGHGCKFINLIIHELPGNGMGSWKQTNDAEIYGCIIYNNGNETGDGNTADDGSGVYIQNLGPDYRNINNNIFFNNFKVGAKLWSASPSVNPPHDFVKNLNFKDNVILNTGSPLKTNSGKECFILDSGNSQENQVVIHDVNVSRNFMYHNTSAIGNALSNRFEVLKIGTSSTNLSNNLAYNLIIEDNYFLGGNGGVRFQKVGNNFNFKHNISKSRYIFSDWNVQSDFIIMNPNNWHLENNTYFTSYSKSYYLRYNPPYFNGGGNSTKRTLDELIVEFGIESETSNRYSPGNFNDIMGTFYKVVQNYYMPNRLKILAFNNEEGDVIVDLSNYIIPEGMSYTIRDAEDYFNILSTNIFQNNEIILELDQAVNLDLPNGSYPAKDTYNKIAKKSDPQVGVFIIDFEGSLCIPNYVLQDITEYTTEEYLAGTSISTAGSSTYYNVEPYIEVQHRAGNYIHLKPGTHIKNGSKYNAKIEACNTSNSRLPYIGETYSNRSDANKTKTHNNTITPEILVSPNPTYNTIDIKSSEDMMSLKLSNAFGRAYFEVQVDNESSKKADLNLNNLPIGIYFLQITLKTGEVITKRVIKK